MTCFDRDHRGVDPEPARPTQHFNRLDEAAAERVAMLMEEAGEVVQICGKILRHGLYSRHPATDEANRTLLMTEITDFFTVAHAMAGREIPRLPKQEEISAAWQNKLRYAHHQR
jgi:hypothetical protein